MNKIVLEHYPTDKLPDDIKAELKGAKSVKLTIEDDSSRGMTREDLLKYLEKPSRSVEDMTSDIRGLRNEWG